MGNVAYKKRHKEQGLCVFCSRPAIPGRTHCLVHSQKNKEGSARWYAKNRERKLAYTHKERIQRVMDRRCISCGAPLGEQDEGCTHCVNCLDRTLRIVSKDKPICGELLENYYKKVAEQS